MLSPGRPSGPRRRPRMRRRRHSARPSSPRRPSGRRDLWPPEHRLRGARSPAAVPFVPTAGPMTVRPASEGLASIRSERFTMHTRLRWGLPVAVAAWLAAPAHAQPPSAAPASPVAPRAADPLDPQAAVPRAVHRSVLSSYRPAGPVEVGSWPQANETVTRIGGWRTYLREAQQPEPSASTAGAASASAVPSSGSAPPAAAGPGAHSHGVHHPPHQHRQHRHPQHQPQPQSRP